MKKYVFIIILVLVAGITGFWWTKNNSSKKSASNSETTGGTPTSAGATKSTPNYPQTIGNFLVTDKEICKENDKPIVYFFGSATCPHCVWEKPIAQKVFGEFKDYISYHENYDSNREGDVFQKYSDINPGYIPFLILGCKYARVGAGESLGKTDEESKLLEEEALSVILCKLTNGKPSTVCDPLKDKTSEIK